MSATLAVLEYHLVGYRRLWRASLLGTFVLPLLTMVGFGIGVGSFVRGGVEGMPYLDWMVPGLIASTAMQMSFSESTWPVLGGFEWRRVYFGQADAPLRLADIIGGHLLFVLIRVLISAAAFLGVAALFGTLHSWWAVAALPVAMLVGLAVAAPTFAYAASVSSDSYLAILIRLGMLPMSLFSGVFFPVDQLPVALRWVAYVLPLWHGVDLSRAATLGVAPDWPVAGHLVYLAAWAAAGWWLATRAFARRLVV
jgi:lipooligosaccharide transport system permease protein